MTVEELTPEIIAIMKQLMNNPQAMEDSLLLQLLFANRMVMGSPRLVHLTAQGG